MRRVGLIGLGVISRYYLAAFERVPGLRLVAVCDRDETALTPMRGRIGCYRDHRRLLAAEQLDAVVVTVPNDRHAGICRDALDAGVSVCVEKPLATRIEDGAEVVNRARQRDLTVFTAFHRRYNSGVDAMLANLPARAPVESVAVHYWERIEEHTGRDAWYLEPASCGGGCVADNGPNAYDLVRMTLGDCRVIDARIARDARGLDRQATVAVRAAAGATGRISLDWSYRGERKDVEIRLADGTVRRTDMLAGHDGFKASLWHEYVGVLADFERALSHTSSVPDPGLSALEFVTATYRLEKTTVEA